MKKSSPHLFILLLPALFFSQCNKKEAVTPPPVVPESFAISRLLVNNIQQVSPVYDVSFTPSVNIDFTAGMDRASVTTGISIKSNAGAAIPFTALYANGDSTVVLQPALQPLTKYTIAVTTSLKTKRNTSLSTGATYQLLTHIDSSNKFPLITDVALLDKVQQQTFSYFWEFGHPVSGMARERNTSDNIVTTGGTGFGVMAIVTAVSRGFIARAEGAERVLKIADFLLNKCTAYHGAFAHWIDGNTGNTIPFSANDNGGDLVETSLLLQGLLTARQYFAAPGVTETDLRNKINTIWNNVEWNWYRQNDQNALYWHWSIDKGWVINQQISGWNEALIVYALAASAPSPANRIPQQVYTNGWARNGAFKNNKTFFGYVLPLGEDFGGPLFLSQYSFLGINPNGLQDAYANYLTQTVNHASINYEYCKANPRGWYGYSATCWGLTASDVPNGYNANAPGSNDVGVIAPTAAIASIATTPEASIKTLRFFYYQLGDKLWGTYGFYDAFKLSDPWFANSYLAIDQGPIIIMIENYRTGLLWNLFTSCPEVKEGMRKLGFTAPYL